MTSSSTPSDNTLPNTNSTSGASGFVLHVLCPSLPPPNRYTFNDLVPSTTIAGLKARISQSIPNRPSPETQRLIYRGKPISNDEATLQRVLEPANGAEYSMHLVLPPGPLPHVAISRPPPSVQSQTPSGISSQSSLFGPSRPAPPYPMPHGQEIRYRAPMGPSEADIGLALRRNIETIRGQIELRERGGSPLPDQQGAGHTQQFPWRRMAQGTPQSSTTTSTSTSTSTSTPIISSNASEIGAHLPQDSRLRLHILLPQIALCEDQLNRGIAPPMDQVIRIRSQLFDILDDQYSNPLSERDGSIEALLTRVFNIYTRADQLRVSQSRASATMQHNEPNGPPNNGHAQAPIYLLSSPSGYQALVTSPGAVGSIESSLNALRATQASHTTSAHIPHANQNPNAAVMENAVRQAVLHQRLGNNEPIGFARNIRRIWLFVRLYFFCYMFSEPGTWSRVLLVAVAVIISLLSETSVPRQLYGMIISPIQRHLEGLVHYSADEHVQPRPQGTEAMGGPRNANESGDNRAAVPTGIRHNIRRVERSLALFLASLVPGVGERHVEVRNAAEAARNAERAREEEERRRQEEANNSEGVAEQEQQDQEVSTASPESSVQNSAIEDGSHPSIPVGGEHGAR